MALTKEQKEQLKKAIEQATGAQRYTYKRDSSPKCVIACLAHNLGASTEELSRWDDFKVTGGYYSINFILSNPSIDSGIRRKLASFGIDLLYRLQRNWDSGFSRRREDVLSLKLILCDWVNSQ